MATSAATRVEPIPKRVVVESWRSDLVRALDNALEQESSEATAAIDSLLSGASDVLRITGAEDLSDQELCDLVADALIATLRLRAA